MRKTMALVNELVDAGYGWANTREERIDDILNWPDDKFEDKVKAMRQRKKQAASTGELSVKINLDTAAFRKQLAAIAKHTKALDDALQAIEDEGDDAAEG